MWNLDTPDARGHYQRASPPRPSIESAVSETRSDGTSSWYTPGANGYINRTDLDSAGNVTNKEWFVYDGLGSCRAMVKPNAQGTEAVLVARYDYDVYGAVRTQSGSSANQFKYVASIGHPTDEETGLIYMRARYYDPQAGRFVSEDPGKDGGNWFAYADNAPTRFVDATGEWTQDQVGSFLYWFGFFIIGVTLVYPSPKVAAASLVAAREALIGLWETFTSALTLIPGAPLSAAVKLALTHVKIAIAESSVIAALLPGATRMALGILGVVMMQWGALLWIDAVSRHDE